MRGVITAAVADGALSGSVTPLLRPGSGSFASSRGADEGHRAWTRGAVDGSSHGPGRRTLAGGVAVAAAPAQAALASSVPVACGFWHGNADGTNATWSAHPCGSVRPAVLGGKAEQPASRLHWSSWNRNPAAGHGRVIHMGTRKVTLRLCDVRTSRGVRHFARMHRSVSGILRWNGHDWV